LLTCRRWPAIIGIVIASLIVFSIVWCLARCLCCGMSCCCSCLSCCDCCTRDRGGNRPKHADGPPTFHNAPYQGYQPAPPPPSYEPPRFAQFDAPTKGGKFNGDALPAMPSWDQAASRKVEDTSHDQDVELAHLENKNGQPSGTIAHQGPTGKGGYSQVPSNPPTPNAEYPNSYRGSEVTNPYASAPTAYGAGAGGAAGVMGASYPRTSPIQTQHEPDPSQAFQRMSPSTQGNFGYGQANGTPSPYNERPPLGAFHNSHTTYNSPPAQGLPTHVSGTQPQRDYTPYTPSASTQYAPSTSPPSQHSGNRPPSLLQPGRNPTGPTWREV
jgi:hypothetical protein